MGWLRVGSEGTGGGRLEQRGGGVKGGGRGCAHLAVVQATLEARRLLEMWIDVLGASKEEVV